MFKKLFGWSPLFFLLFSCGRIGVERVAGDSESMGGLGTDTSSGQGADGDLLPATGAEADSATDIDDGTDTSPRWEPNILPGLVFWLDADYPPSVVTDVGVAEWRDRSGNNRHATQTTGTAQPTLFPNAFESRPAMAFDGIDDFLVVEDYTPLVDYDAFLVWKSPVLPSIDELTALVRYGGEQFNTNIEITHGHYMDTFRNAATLSMGGGYLVARFDDPAIDTPYLWQMTFDSVLGRLTSRTNGHFSNQYGDFPGPPDSEGAGLGIGARVNAIQHFRGFIAEIIIYDRVLSDAERVRIEAYLKSKWNWVS
jgi:hypothetical protein